MTFIKQVIYRFAIAVAWTVNIIFPYRKLVHVLIPASTGSLGDQALLAGLLNLLTRKYPGMRLRQVLFPGWEQFYCPGVEQMAFTALPSSIKYGGSWLRDELRFVFTLLSCRHFTVIGADVMDGRYDPVQILDTVKLCNLAIKSGVSVTILGFSFSDSPNPMALAALRKLDPRVVCLCRDAVSLERFQRLTQHPAELAADLAFNMKPKLEAPSAVKAAQWIKEQRDNGKRIIGLNANVLTVEGTGVDILQSYANELTKILEGNDDIVCLMLPHDLREGQSDYVTLKSIAERMHQSYKDRVYLVAPAFNAWDIKALAGTLDLVIAGRMHLVIGALAGTVPSVGITYMGKFEGMFNYFDCPELLFDPSGLATDGKLASFISNILPKLDNYKIKITKALPKVVELSARNVERI